MRRQKAVISSIFEDSEPLIDHSSEFDKHLSKQSVPRLPQTGFLYDLCNTESVNDREERIMTARGHGNWEDKWKYVEQTGPGASNIVPGSFCCEDRDPD